MARVIAMLAVVFGVFLGGSSAFGGVPPTDIAVVVYTYDAPAHDGVTTFTAFERGPPVAIHNPKTISAAGSGSRSVLVRPGGSRISSQHGYDVTLRLVRGVSGMGTTSGPSQVTNGELSSLVRWQVAANGADDLIRLSTKDSWANLKTLDDHFARHGADVGATSADDYARIGSEFFQRGGAQHLPTKIAPDGTIRMFDPATNTFGSFAPNGMTKTIFKPTSPDYWSRQPGVLQ